MLGHIQPIVLVGGRSSRFGRDKLREPWRGSEGGQWLVDQPRLVLERVFGPRVWCAGTCNPDVAARFSRAVSDELPGAGPVGGLVSSLRAAKTDVLVLAGDLPRITVAEVRGLLEAGAANPDDDAIVGLSDHPEPCIAIYRQSSLPALQPLVGPGKRPPLNSILHSLDWTGVPLACAAVVNANRTADLA